MTETPALRLRVATYNVHGCVGLDRQRSEGRIADVIASLSADIVGLQELDANRQRSAGVDQAALIAQQLGWNHIFQPAMRNGDEQYGNAIISRYPLTLRRMIELPGQGTWYCRETRVAMWGEAETELGPLQVINTHFGLGRTERFLQAQRLASAEHIGSASPQDALILLGDFNSLPTSRAIRFLGQSLRDARIAVGEGRLLRTFPTRLPAVAVDHIFANATLQPLSIAVHRSALARTASDHFPLVAEFTRDE